MIFRLLFLASIHFFWMYADDKITQIVYAEGQYNPYADENEQQNRKIVYYLKDKTLYMHDIEDNLVLTNDRKMSMYPFKDKIKQWSENEVMHIDVLHIGQPTNIKTDGITKWTMPLVTKEQWILGNLFRTDLCVIGQEKVARIKEQEQGSEIELVSEEEPSNVKTIYPLRKIGVGHRAPTNFVGLCNVQKIDELPDKKGWAVLSSSTWPTIKWSFLNPNTNGRELRDEYVLDSQPGENGFILKARIKKSFFNINQISSVILHRTNKDPLTIGVELFSPYHLPKIILNPTFILEKDDNIITQSIQTIMKNKILQTKDIKHTVYIIAKNKVLFVPINKKYSVFSSRHEALLNSNFKNDNAIITSSAMNFEDNQLFLGIYDEATKKSSIQTIEIKNNEGKV